MSSPPDSGGLPTDDEIEEAFRVSDQAVPASAQVGEGWKAAGSPALAALWPYFKRTRQDGAFARFGRFFLRKVLGRGGFGVVFEAFDDNGQVAAVKILWPNLGKDDTGLERFLRQARRVADVSSSYLVRILEVGIPPNFPLPCLVMELVKGQSLHDYLASTGRPTPVRAAEIIRDAALGLVALHTCNPSLVHRDVSPGNIMVLQETCHAQLTDFDLLLHSERDSCRITGSNGLAATLRYLSPERIREPGRIDPRDDLYSLGVVLDDMLNHEELFSNSTGAILASFPAHAAHRPPMPRGLEFILNTCLDASPSHRYRSAKELATDLQAFIDRERSFRARFRLWRKRARRWVRHHRARTTLAVAFACVLVGSAVWLLRDNMRLEADKATITAHANRADLHAAAMAIKTGNYSAAVELLNGCPGRRCFAWGLLWRRCHPEERAFTDPSGEVRALSVEGVARSLVATAGGDGRVRIWDPVAGQLVRELVGHTARVNGVAIAPKGFESLVASASDDRTVRLWDLNSGKELAVWYGHDQPPTSIVFSRLPGQDQGYGAVWSADPGGHVHCWNALKRALRPEKTFRHAGGVSQLAADASETMVYSIGLDGSVRSWDYKDGEPKSFCKLPSVAQGAPPAAAASGKVLWFGLANGVIGNRCDPKDDPARDWLAHRGKAVRALVLIPGEDSLASGGEDGSVLKWPGANGFAPQLLAGHLDPITALAVIPGKTNDMPRLLVSADAKGLVKVTNLLNEPGQTKANEAPTWFADLHTTAYGDCRVRKGEGNSIEILGARGYVLLVLEVEGEPVRMSFSPDGMELAAEVIRPNGKTEYRIWHAGPPK